MAANSMLIFKMAQGPKLSKKKPKPISTIYWEGKEKHPVFNAKNGEKCITTYRDNMHWAKLAYHGVPGIWIGYAEGHPTGTYWVINRKTRKIILTRELTFLQKLYGEYSKIVKSVLVTMSCEGSDDEEELKKVPIISNDNDNSLNSASNSETNFENNNKNVFDEDIDEEVEATPKTTINAKVVQAMKKLEASYDDKKKCHHKFKLLNWSCHGGQWPQANT